MSQHADSLQIGTWNMEGKCTAQHMAFLDEMKCDALLLTEVPHRLQLGSGCLVRSTPAMGLGKDWSAVWTKRPGTEVVTQHALTAASQLAGTLLVSTVLPWRGSGNHDYWRGSAGGPAAWTEDALREVQRLLDSHTGHVVFGGDFNHALQGPEYAGSRAGRVAIQGFLDAAGLWAPTGGLPHRGEGRFSIDHIAIPSTWSVTSTSRFEGGRLSDHDAYVVESVVEFGDKKTECDS